MAQSKVVNVVEKLIRGPVEEMGLELVDVEFVKEGGHWYLRIFIDKDGGVGLDDCQAVSDVVNPLLDEKDPIAQSYLLEVSSPGIERPLKKLRDFEQFLGHNINATTFSPINGSKKFTGRLLRASAQEIVLDSKGLEVAIPMSQLASASLAVQF